MEYLIVYKWRYNNAIFNHYHSGRIKINLREVEAEIRNKTGEHEENLIFINIIQLGQKYK